MDTKTLYNSLDFVNNVFSVSKNKTYNSLEWHAAEPLMVPIKWYESAEKYILNRGYIFKRVMCSNFTLLSKNWIQFMKKYKYTGSTSLDGDKFIHDYNRGHGTFEKTIEGIIKMRENNIKFGVICVLTEYSCDNDEELYPFFKLAGIPVKFNPEIPNTFNEKCAKTMMKLYDMWYEDDRMLKMNPFDEMERFIIGDKSIHKCYLPCGEHIFSVDTFGDVYPCSSFVHNRNFDEHKYGNVNIDSWNDIWYGKNRMRFLDFKNNIPQKCLECDYRLYCSGGCTRDSVVIGNVIEKMGSTCGIIKPLMNHIAKNIGVS